MQMKGYRWFDRFPALASLVLLFFQGGCTLVWHVSSPDIQVRTLPQLSSNNVMAYRLAYRASHLAESVYENEKLKFRESIEAALERAGFRLVDERESNKVLDIHVRESPPQGAAAHEFLTGLTLGVIPTWATREGTFEFALRLCRKDSELARVQYLLNTKTFN